MSVPSETIDVGERIDESGLRQSRYLAGVGDEIPAVQPDDPTEVDTDARSDERGCAHSHGGARPEAFPHVALDEQQG